MSEIGAAVIGTGFIGAVHIEALRRLDVEICGVLGSSLARSEERAAALGVAKAYPSLDLLLQDPQVKVVHVTSPNKAHYPQVMQILKAGRHVVCEKPLAMTAKESGEMAKLAKKTGLVAAVCHEIRFYPLNQQARGMMMAGEFGDIRLITGYFHQDWLALPTDWNWRLDRKEGGALRSVGDIGTHWLDLTGFITGLRATQVFADLATFIKERQKPVGPVETFSKSRGKTVKQRIQTDDVSTVMLRYANGAKGVMSTSQVSFGKKCSLVWDITGSKASAAWDFEAPEQLWIGHRLRPNEYLQRDPSLMNPLGRAAAGLPGGHVEGFADAWVAFFRQVYADVAKGGPSKKSTYATFDDGHYEMLFCEAVLKSAKLGKWVDIGKV